MRSSTAVGLVVLFALAACGDDGGTAEPTTDSTDASSSPPSSGGQPASADSWSVHQPDLVDAAFEEGRITLTLTGPALWFQNSQGVLVFQPVTGDFDATATVRSESASMPGQPPAPMIRLAGLMARDPASDLTGTQNYVHVVVGNGPNGVLAVETKTTVDGSSVYEAPVWPSPDAELRICRVGSTFDVYKRPVGTDTWERAASYDRPDLPKTLQVGVDIYSPNSPPDLRAMIDDISFEEFEGPAHCNT
jgi:hypothetical protein